MAFEIRPEATFEVRQETGYGLIPKAVTRRSDLSLGAKAVYAYLASFAGNTGVAFPSMALMMEELNISKNTLRKYLKELQEKGLVIVEQGKDGTQFANNIYYLTNVYLLPSTNSSVAQNLTPNNNRSISYTDQDTYIDLRDIDQPVDQNLVHGDPANDDGESLSTDPVAQNLVHGGDQNLVHGSRKKKHGDFVLLTDSEYQRLVELMGEDELRYWIESLDSYIGSKGRKYKSHYHTIRNWYNRNQKEREERWANKPGYGFSDQDFTFITADGIIR